MLKDRPDPARDLPSPDILALQAAAFVAADEVLLTRFLGLSGLDLADFRAILGETAGQVAVLDFLLGHEPDLIAFAQEIGIGPEQVMAARVKLDPQGFDA